MNEYQQYYAQQLAQQMAPQFAPQFAPQQLAPQGFFGGILGAPLGGLIGRGIGGLLGNANLGRQIGQAAGGIGGSFLPFAADPVAAAYAQQAQQEAQLQQLQQQGLAPQGWFGNIVKRVAQPLGGAIGGAFGNAGLGNTIGGIAGQLGGMLPFGADPVALAYAQQAQQEAQLQQLQQQGLAPQGWFGNIVKRVAQPLGGAIGGAFGNAGLGNTIGGIAGHLGGMLPFAADPVALAYAQGQQEAQLQQQSWLGDLLRKSRPASGVYSPFIPPRPSLLPFDADPMSQAYAQGQQDGQMQGLAPQGWFGNIIKSVAQPLGGAIGGAFGNAGLGNTIGGIAGQLGGMLPFGADPMAAAYVQQAQLAQLANQGNLYGGQQTLH